MQSISNQILQARTRTASLLRTDLRLRSAMKGALMQVADIRYAIVCQLGEASSVCLPSKEFLTDNSPRY